MSGTRKTLEGRGTETPRIVLNEDLFRRRTRALGARTDRERCAVAGVSRASLNRWRRGTVKPSLDSLRTMARRLEVDFDELIREVPA